MIISGHSALPYYRRERYRTLSHRRLRHRAVSVITLCGSSDPIYLGRSRTLSGRGISALGQKQTCAAQKVMSALPPKADICECLAIERERGSVEADLLWALVAVQADVLARKRGKLRRNIGRLQRRISL